MSEVGSLKNKHILLIITGSIAAYKTLELTSKLKKMGACVRVVMSEEAKKFIAPLSFEALAHSQVLYSQTENWVKNENNPSDISCNHISYASWADIAIVAPATANTLAKIASGICDNLALSTLLACKAPKLLAPAMNTAMLEAPQTQSNLIKLNELGFEIVPPRTTLLACDTYGNGAMAEVDEIVFCLSRSLLQQNFWQGKKVIVTGGGSIENIDRVRAISNHSSGLQASYLALSLYLLGAKVCFISSKFPIVLPSRIECIKAHNGASFLQAIQTKLTPDETLLFMAAAISDYMPQNPIDGKLKKEQIGENYEIKCQKTLDILSNLSAKNLIKIGFKAECDKNTAISAAKKMLENSKDGGKGCIAVCLNIIDEHNQFGGIENEITLISKESIHRLNRASKFELSFEIARFTQNLLC